MFSVSDKRQTAALYKSLALKYSKHFNFGVIRKPSAQFVQQFNIKKLPSIVVMLSTLISKKLTFSSIPYDIKAYGEISYLTVTRFLYSVHETHWKDLPNINKFKGQMTLKDDYMKEIEAILSPEQNEKETKSNNFEIQEITHKNHKQFCGDKTIGLCFVVFLDGHDENTKKESFQLMTDVQNALQNEGMYERLRDLANFDANVHICDWFLLIFCSVSMECTQNKIADYYVFYFKQ